MAPSATAARHSATTASRGTCFSRPRTRGTIQNVQLWSQPWITRTKWLTPVRPACGRTSPCESSYRASNAAATLPQQPTSGALLAAAGDVDERRDAHEVKTAGCNITARDGDCFHCRVA